MQKRYFGHADTWVRQQSTPPDVALQGQLVQVSATHRHPKACDINIVQGLEAPAMAMQATLEYHLYLCNHIPGVFLQCF